MKLVENYRSAGPPVLSIWLVIASSNQLLQHYAFNESAKPQLAQTSRAWHAPAKGHTT
jgi:hypothetical protein